MNNTQASILRNDRGSALLITVLVLVAVTVIGILASRTAYIEHLTASYDKFHKMTWFATDAVVTGLMPELIEQNIEKRGFGNGTIPFTYGNANSLDIYTSDFYNNDTCSIPSETNRDIQANGLSGTTVHTTVYGVTGLNPGNAIQLPEGYRGIGHSLAGGGAQTLFVIRGLGRGSANSQARITSGWRHVI